MLKPEFKKINSHLSKLTQEVSNIEESNTSIRKSMKEYEDEKPDGLEECKTDKVINILNEFIGLKKETNGHLTTYSVF